MAQFEVEVSSFSLLSVNLRESRCARAGTYLREIRSVEADSHAVEPVAVHAAAEIAGFVRRAVLHLFLRGHDSGLSRVDVPHVVKRDVVIVPFDSRFQQVEEDDALVVFGLVAGYARFVAQIDGLSSSSTK